MPLSPSGCGVYGNLTANGHKEADTRSRRCSQFLALSAWRRCIIDNGRFLQVVRQRQEEGIEVRCRFKIDWYGQRRCHCRGKVNKQASEGGYLVTI